MNNNWKNELSSYLPETIITAINKLPTSVVCSVSEIRLRAGGYSSVTVKKENKPLFDNNKPIILYSSQIHEVFNKICDGAVFKHENSIPKGYITIKGGHRVGFCGRAIHK